MENPKMLTLSSTRLSILWRENSWEDGAIRESTVRMGKKKKEQEGARWGCGQLKTNEVLSECSVYRITKSGSSGVQGGKENSVD